jgi:uncharacterized protein
VSAPVPGEPVDFNELADRFHAAIVRGDTTEVRRCFTPDAAVWHNYDRREQSRDQVLRILSWLQRHVDGLRYEDVRRQPTPTGYVQQHVLHGKAPDGTALEVAGCLVVTLQSGLIARIDEYLDSAAVAALLA